MCSDCMYPQRKSNSSNNEMLVGIYAKPDYYHVVSQTQARCLYIIPFTWRSTHPLESGSQHT